MDLKGCIMESTGTDLQKNFTTVIIISRKTQAPVLVYFMQKGKNKEVKDPKFPILSAEVEQLKNTEGGTEAVCEVMKIYEEKARAEGMAEGRKEGLAALVRSLGKVLPSFEDIYKAIVANEKYKDVSREDVFMLYGH